MRRRALRWVAVSLACAARSVFAGTLDVAADAESVSVPLPPTTETALIVEIDGYDVTAVVRIEFGVLILPARGLALAPGEHRLRVLVSQPSGDIDTILEHVLEVAGSREASHSQSLNVLLGSQWRVAEHRDEDFAGTNRAEHRATLQWGAQRESAAWALRGAMNALYDSVTANSPGGSVWQAPDYLLQAERRFESGSVGVALGDDPVALGNLLFSGFSRRGLRVDFRALDERVQMQAFTLNSEPVTRFDAEVIPHQRAGSVQGGFAAIAPVTAHPEWLRITSGYVNGETSLGGVGIASADTLTQYGGQAWNTALDSWSMGSALWLHAEYARSRFDSDGLNNGEGEFDDDATHFAAQLSSNGRVSIPGIEQWTLGAEHQRVGPRFYSLGNFMLPGDLALDHNYLRFGTHGLQVSADDTRHHSNVERNPLVPRRRGNTRALTANYSPPAIDPGAGIWRVLGIPSLNFEWQDVAWRQAPEDALLAGFDLDSRTRMAAFGIDLTRDTLSLSLRHSRTRSEDRSSPLVVDDLEIYAPSPDTVERSLSAQLTWLWGSRLSVSPQWQTTRLREPLSGASSRSALWGLQAQAEIKPDRLWLQANYSQSSDRPPPFDPFTPVATLRYGGGAASLVYRAHSAGERSPDIDLNLSGQYVHAFEQDTWQVMLGFSVNWQKESP